MGCLHLHTLIPSPLRRGLGRGALDEDCPLTEAHPLLNPPRKGEEAKSTSGSTL